MAKSRTKEIAREKTPQERVKDSYSYEKACNAAKNSGTPTYHFAVGDRVQVGHLPNCVVEEVMDDGAMYLIRVTTKNNVEYSCWAWTSVRPLDDDKDTHFAKRDSALSRLHYSNRSMYSLLSFHYLFGVDFKPDYQRGSVWDEEDREKLLDSIFAGREIGRFVFKQLPFNRTNDDGNYYEIVDGKQRIVSHNKQELDVVASGMEAMGLSVETGYYDPDDESSVDVPKQLIGFHYVVLKKKV